MQRGAGEPEALHRVLLIRAEGLSGSDWRPIDADGLRVEVAGYGRPTRWS